MLQDQNRLKEDDSKGVPNSEDIFKTKVFTIL